MGEVGYKEGHKEGRASAGKEERFSACGVKGGEGEGIDTAFASVLLVKVFIDYKLVNQKT